MADDLSTALPPSLRTAYQKSARRLSPTLQKLRFGNTAALSKLTREAERLATVADNAQSAWEAIHDIHWRSQADQTATEGGRLVRSATHAKLRIGTITANHNEALNAAEAKLAQLKRTIDKALTPPATAGEAMLDSEARAMIRAATDPSTAAAIARANPRAVATAPASLAGVAPHLRDSILSEYLQSTVPEESAQYSDLLAAVRSAGEAAASLDTETRHLIDFTLADRLESRKVPA